MSVSRLIFHLSFPVADLAASRDFYVDVLGAQVGRVRDQWMDMLLWGHQITLQLDPAAVTSLAGQGRRHFGVVMPWADWQVLAARLERNAGDHVLQAPAVTGDGDAVQAKVYLRDPSNNVIEIKAYRNFAAVLGTQDAAYASNTLT